MMIPARVQPTNDGGDDNSGGRGGDDVF